MPKTTGIQPAAGAVGTSQSYSPSLDDVAAGRASLRRGMSGESVRALQQLLKDSGQSLAVDGAFGPQTDAAVRAFQRQNGLTVDGVVGPKTLGALRGETPPAQNPFATDEMEETRPQTPSTQTSTPITGLPSRPADAMTGSEFMARTAGMSRTQREQAILAELQKGNIPDFLRQWKEIEVKTTGPDGVVHTGKVRVMPDYLAIGSNDDFVRIPMSPLTAQRIADQYGCSLPTTKIVDDIWKQAEVQLTPNPMRAGPQMMSNDYYLRHQQAVERQFDAAGGAPGALTAGHKKDVVISNRLAAHPDRVAIYGWQQAGGKNIQPLSTVHENTYADYSHGIRMVSSTMVVDGVERPLEEILRDPVLCKLVSSEGVIRNPRQPS
ncbi:MAG: peptidoglycan-binding domain-containing protein [Myxococcales bacterium]